MLVQASHSATLNQTDWKPEWEGEVILSHLSKTSGGVVLLFSKNVLPESCVMEEKVKGRLMVDRAKYEFLPLFL